jgi:aryl-alcohol dehydrogenase-like predicted oxidoreductase
MKYRTLGKTGINVSVVGLGTWQFGGEWGKNFGQEEVNAILRRGRELGINLIDTAECYGDHLSESLIGGAIQGARDREHWIIATKFGHKFHGWMNRTDERDVTHVREQLEGSLRALRTDSIDIYQYHSVRDAEFFNEALWEFLAGAKKAGKIRHIGNSISSKIDPRAQGEASERAGVEVLQVVYNRLERQAEETVFPMARRLNLGVLARVPLASGYLSGKYRPGAKFAAGDFREKEDPRKVEEMIRKAQEIQRTEAPAGVEMAQWALAWCLRDAAVSAVIPGCKSVGQVEANAKAAELIEE